MEKKLLIYPFFLFAVLLLPTLIQAPDLCSYRGYANKSGTLVNTTDIITVYNANKNYNATIFTDGSYTLDVEATPFVNITFRICGVAVVQGQQNFTCPATTLNTLNLSISTLANGASCTYSCGCSGGYCCSGATEYTNGEGTGTCQASVCTAPAAAAGVGAAAGEAAAPAKEVTVTKTISLVTPTAPAVATIETDKAKDLKVDKVTVQVKEAVSNIQVTVKESSLPSGASVAISSAAGSTYKYLEITTTVEAAKLEKVKINFKVEKSWISTNSIDEEKVVLQKYADNKWNKLTTTKTSSDATYVYYESETSALSVFTITGEKKVAVAPVEEKKCPACPQPTPWSDCIAEKQTRTNYRCSADTNYECHAYTEELACKVVAPPVIKVPKLPSTAIFIILAVILFLIFYQFGKGKAILRLKPKKKK